MSAPPKGFRLWWPLAPLPDGRVAQITSAYRSKTRPDHDGVDMFYPWAKGDEPSFVGDGGCAHKLPNGLPKWGVPYGTMALAATGGRVTSVGPSHTGFRVWLDSGYLWRTGYFHLAEAFVRAGDLIIAHQPLGLVGDNPADRDARHLHFELSPTKTYSPIDPTPFLARWSIAKAS